MIRKDFEDEGFPICYRNPVLCYTSENKLFIVYNRTDLWKVLNNREILKCVGIWPGKKNTDCFVLSPEKYKTGPHTEEIHKNIDSAKEIQIILSISGEFLHIQYVLDAEEEIPVTSDSKELFSYVKSSALKYKAIRQI